MKKLILIFCILTVGGSKNSQNVRAKFVPTKCVGDEKLRHNPTAEPESFELLIVSPTQPRTTF